MKCKPRTWKEATLMKNIAMSVATAVAMLSATAALACGSIQNGGCGDGHDTLRYDSQSTTIRTAITYSPVTGVTVWGAQKLLRQSPPPPRPYKQKPVGIGEPNYFGKDPRTGKWWLMFQPSDASTARTVTGPDRAQLRGYTDRNGGNWVDFRNTAVRVNNQWTTDGSNNGNPH